MDSWAHDEGNAPEGARAEAEEDEEEGEDGDASNNEGGAGLATRDFRDLGEDGVLAELGVELQGQRKQWEGAVKRGNQRRKTRKPRSGFPPHALF